MGTAHRQVHAKGRGGVSDTSRKRIVARVIVALVAIWLVAFILSNFKTVSVSLVFGHVALALIWVMIVCAVLGAALAWAIPRLSRR